MQTELSAGEIFSSWQPKELGLPRATGISLALVVAIMAFCLWAATALGPKPVPQVIQITQAQTVQLPAPTPPPPPKVIPPPKPLPVVIQKPPPVESKIVVPVKPPPPRPVAKPVRRVIHPPAKPVARPVTKPVVAAPAPPQATPAPARPAAAPTSGLPIYGEHMHAILQANQSVPPALAALGIGGTAVVAIVVAPDGHVASARIYRSSGNPLIDQTALDHALHASFGLFNANMPGTAQTFIVPVDIEPQSD